MQSPLSAKVNELGSTSVQSVVMNVHAVSDAGWEEESLTWGNRPVKGPVIATRTLTNALEQQIDIDVTGYVRDEIAAGRWDISLALANQTHTTANVYTRIASRERGPGPQLLITYDAASGWRWPVSGSCVRDSDAVRYPFGPRKLSNGTYDFHAGIDIPPPNPTVSPNPDVHAVAGGTVVAMDQTSTGGRRVFIYHGNNQWTAYLHLDSYAGDLYPGKHVQPGHVLGAMGSTGANSTHLHLTYQAWAGPKPQAGDERIRAGVLRAGGA